MKAVKHDRCNVNLTLPGGTAANDLPAEKVRVRDETLGDSWAIETTWLLDETERESVAAGAPVCLRVMGEGHPAVALFVPEVPPDRAAIDRDHAARAIGRLYALVAEGHHFSTVPTPESDATPTMEPTAFLGLWEQAVADTVQAAGEADRVIAQIQAEATDRPTDDRAAVLARVRTRLLRENDGDKIAAAVHYLRSVRDAVGRQQAEDAAVEVFDLDDVERAAARDLDKRGTDAS